MIGVREDGTNELPAVEDGLPREHRVAFYAFLPEHWRHLRTSTAIESSFATVKLRTRVRKVAGSKKAAQERWRRFNGHELVADVLAGALASGPRPGSTSPTPTKTHTKSGRRPSHPA